MSTLSYRYLRGFSSEDTLLSLGSEYSNIDPILFTPSSTSMSSIYDALAKVSRGFLGPQLSGDVFETLILELMEEFEDYSLSLPNTDFGFDEQEFDQELLPIISLLSNSDELKMSDYYDLSNAFNSLSWIQNLINYDFSNMISPNLFYIINSDFIYRIIEMYLFFLIRYDPILHLRNDYDISMIISWLILITIFIVDIWDAVENKGGPSGGPSGTVNNFLVFVLSGSLGLVAAYGKSTAETDYEIFIADNFLTDCAHGILQVSFEAILESTSDPSREDIADYTAMLFELFLGAADTAQTWAEGEDFGSDDQLLYAILGSILVDFPDAVLPITVNNGKAFGITIIAECVGLFYLMYKIIYPYPNEF